MFEYGKMDEELAAFTDSDWAGCKETRKSSSAGVMILGRHTLKAYTRKQEGHRKEQCRSGVVGGSIGTVGSKGSPKDDARLGLCSEASVEH